MPTLTFDEDGSKLLLVCHMGNMKLRLYCEPNFAIETSFIALQDFEFKSLLSFGSL